MRWVVHPTRLVIIGAVVLVAAVPAPRRELVWQVGALARAVPQWSTSAYARYVSGHDVFYTPSVRDIEAALRARPRDLQLLTGLAAPPDCEYETPIAREALREALRLAPDEPVVLSIAALREFRTGGKLSYSREEGERRRKQLQALPPGIHGPPQPVAPGAAPEYEEDLLTAEQIAGPLAALDVWASADPANAAPDAIAVCLLLGAKRDDEALARAEAAAGKGAFTLYDMELMGARMHADRLCGAPAGDAALSTLATLLPEWARLRESARVMNVIGWDHFDDGDSETAFRYWLATARLGGLIRTQDREYLTGRLVGIAITALGYAPIYRWRRDPEGEGRFEGGDFESADAHAAFVATWGRGAGERVYAELASAQRLRQEGKATSPASERFLEAHYVYDPARKVHMLALPAAMLAALLCLALVVTGGRAPPSLSRRWSALLVFAAVIAPMAALIVARAVEATRGWEYWFWEGLQRTTGPYVLAIGGPAALVGLVALAAVWVIRKKGVGYGAALLGGLRQTLPTALAALAVVWVAATAVAIHKGAFASRHIARVIEVGEVRAMEELGSRQE